MDNNNNPAAAAAAQLQSEVMTDLNQLSAKLYSSMRMLRNVLTEEAGEGVMAYHIFGNATLQQISKRIPRSKEELLEINGITKEKIRKYGDRVLEIIEGCIKEHYKDKNSCCCCCCTESKRGRRATNDDDDLIAKKRNRTSEAVDAGRMDGSIKKIEIHIHIHGR